MDHGLLDGVHLVSEYMEDRPIHCQKWKKLTSFGVVPMFFVRETHMFSLRNPFLAMYNFWELLGWLITLIEKPKCTPKSTERSWSHFSTQKASWLRPLHVARIDDTKRKTSVYPILTCHCSAELEKTHVFKTHWIYNRGFLKWRYLQIIHS